MVPTEIVRWLPVVAVSVAVFPLGLLAVWLLVGRARRRGVPADVARRRSVALVAMIGGTLPWIWMILTPLPESREIRPIPLRDLADQLGAAPVTAFFQIVGNLLVFAAFGFFAAARWRIRVPAVVAVAAAASLTVEALQYVLALGRVSSVDDVLLNAAGAGIAALAYRRWRPPELAWGGQASPLRYRRRDNQPSPDRREYP
jgi:hypothetical protein